MEESETLTTIAQQAPGQDQRVNTAEKEFVRCQNTRCHTTIISPGRSAKSWLEEEEYRKRRRLPCNILPQLYLQPCVNTLLVSLLLFHNGDCCITVDFRGGPVHSLRTIWRILYWLRSHVGPGFWHWIGLEVSKDQHETRRLSHQWTASSCHSRIAIPDLLLVQHGSVDEGVLLPSQLAAGRRDSSSVIT
jgi:hypothetical protein